MFSCTGSGFCIVWQNVPGSGGITESGMACVHMSLEWVLFLDAPQIPRTGGSVGVFALALMVFSRPLMLGCLRFLSVPPVLSATHTLISSQTDLHEWMISRLWGGLLPVAAPLCKQASHTAACSSR